MSAPTVIKFYRSDQQPRTLRTLKFSKSGYDTLDKAQQKCNEDNDCLSIVQPTAKDSKFYPFQLNSVSLPLASSGGDPVNVWNKISVVPNNGCEYDPTCSVSPSSTAPSTLQLFSKPLRDGSVREPDKFYKYQGVIVQYIRWKLKKQKNPPVVILRPADPTLTDWNQRNLQALGVFDFHAEFRATRHYKTTFSNPHCNIKTAHYTQFDNTDRWMKNDISDSNLNCKLSTYKNTVETRQPEFKWYKQKHHTRVGLRFHANDPSDAYVKEGFNDMCVFRKNKLDAANKKTYIPTSSPFKQYRYQIDKWTIQFSISNNQLQLNFVPYNFYNITTTSQMAEWLKTQISDLYNYLKDEGKTDDYKESFEGTQCNIPAGHAWKDDGNYNYYLEQYKDIDASQITPNIDNLKQLVDIANGVERLNNFDLAFKQQNLPAWIPEKFAKNVSYAYQQLNQFYSNNLNGGLQFYIDLDFDIESSDFKNFTQDNQWCPSYFYRECCNLSKNDDGRMLCDHMNVDKRGKYCNMGMADYCEFSPFSDTKLCGCVRDLTDPGLIALQQNTGKPDKCFKPDCNPTAGSYDPGTQECQQNVCGQILNIQNKDGYVKIDSKTRIHLDCNQCQDNRINTDCAKYEQTDKCEYQPDINFCLTPTDENYFSKNRVKNGTLINHFSNDVCQVNCQYDRAYQRLVTCGSNNMTNCQARCWPGTNKKCNNQETTDMGKVLCKDFQSVPCDSDGNCVGTWSAWEQGTKLTNPDTHADDYKYAPYEQKIFSVKVKKGPGGKDCQFTFRPSYAQNTETITLTDGKILTRPSLMNQTKKNQCGENKDQIGGCFFYQGKNDDQQPTQNVDQSCKYIPTTEYTCGQDPSKKDDSVQAYQKFEVTQQGVGTGKKCEPWITELQKKAKTVDDKIKVTKYFNTCQTPCVYNEEKGPCVQGKQTVTKTLNQSKSVTYCLPDKILKYEIDCNSDRPSKPALSNLNIAVISISAIVSVAAIVATTFYFVNKKK